MATNTANIDRFNLTAITLFDRLYDAFPNPIDIDSKEIGIEAAPEQASTGESVRFIIYAESAVSWLAEEGFIRYESPSSGTTFRRVRLTLKGLTVLGYLPTSIQTGKKAEPLIARIKKVLAGGAEKAGTEAVKGLITEAFKLAAPFAISAASSVLSP